MLVAIVVLCVIVVIALPMHAVRAKKSEQVHAKAQLMLIKESQDRYKMEHGDIYIGYYKACKLEERVQRNTGSR